MSKFVVKDDRNFVVVYLALKGAKASSLDDVKRLLDVDDERAEGIITSLFDEGLIKGEEHHFEFKDDNFTDSPAVRNAADRLILWKGHLTEEEKEKAQNSFVHVYIAYDLMDVSEDEAPWILGASYDKDTLVELAEDKLTTTEYTQYDKNGFDSMRQPVVKDNIYVILEKSIDEEGEVDYGIGFPVFTREEEARQWVNDAAATNGQFESGSPISYSVEAVPMISSETSDEN